jgi:hypothetical protein
MYDNIPTADKKLQWIEGTRTIERVDEFLPAWLERNAECVKRRATGFE